MCTLRVSTGSLVLVCVLLATFVQIGTSLKCYHCDATQDMCKDEFDTDKVESTECTATAVSQTFAGQTLIRRLSKNIDVKNLDYVCMKLSITGNDKKKDGVTRGCAYNVENMCEMIGVGIRVDSKEEQWLKACNLCRKDDCNSASGVAASFAAIFVGLLAFLLIQ